MKIIRARLEYEDGILFQVLDPQTKETELVGEATIVKYITTGRMKNATLVHKEGSVPFIRVSGGKNISYQQKMPIGTDKGEQAETNLLSQNAIMELFMQSDIPEGTDLGKLADVFQYVPMAVLAVIFMLLLFRAKARGGKLSDPKAMKA